ncbi:MAG TPA: DNA gyrase modulator, partial [Nitriliruptorales bacterium]
MTTLRDRLDEVLLRDVLRTALAGGGDFAEVYAEDRRTRSLSLEDQRVEELSAGRDVGAGIRVVSGDRSGYAHTNHLTRAALLEAAKVAAASAKGDAKRSIADFTRPERRIEHRVKRDPFEVDLGSLVALATDADEAARAVGGGVSQVVISYGDTQQQVVIANSEGRLADDHRTRTRLFAQVVAARGERIQTGYESAGTAGGHELFDSSPPAQVG